MSGIKRRPNFIGQGTVTQKEPVAETGNNQSKPGWKEILFGDTFLGKVLRVFLAFFIAWFVLWLAEIIWFNHHSLSVNAQLDFWAKTLCIFGAAGLILVIVDLVFKTKGGEVKVAFALLFCVTVAAYYFPAPYYENGKPTVYVNSRTGDIYQYNYSKIQNDPISGKNYFLHPRSNDTCWNESPENVELLGSSSSAKPAGPTSVINYLVSGSPYVFRLKAGESMDHWIGFDQTRKVHIDLSSSDYDYYIIYSGGDSYHGGIDAVIPDHELPQLYLKAGATDQVITMKLSYQ